MHPNRLAQLKRSAMVVVAVVVFTAASACGRWRGKGGQSDPQGQGTTVPLDPFGYFFANYFVGSDLEDGKADKPNPDHVGLATADLLEISEAMARGQEASLGLLMAMGGAKKSTWAGIKYLDAPCLIKDSQDGVFGNDICAVDASPSASMSKKETLVQFLKKVKERSVGYKRTIVNFWDHGAGYGGFGQAHGPGADGRTLLKSREIRDAFIEADLHVDLITFDACLMASVEVAYNLRDAGNYLLASEEKVPGMGFDYRSFISSIIQNPTAPVKDLAAKFGEAYLNGKSVMFSSKDFTKIRDFEHKKNDGRKTVSVVELGHIAELAAAAADLFKSAANESGQLQLMLASANKVLRFGEEPGLIRGQQIYNSFDLRDLLDKWDLSPNADLGAKSIKLKDAIGRAVVWRMDDGRLPTAYGLSIKDPTNIRDWFKYDEADSALASGWSNLGSRLKDSSQDNVPPVLVSEDPGKCQTPSPDYRQGICTKITDNGVITQVNAYTVVQIDGADIAVTIERAPYLPITDRFILPDYAFSWFDNNGKPTAYRYNLCNWDTADCVELPVYLESIKPLRGKAKGTVNDQSVDIEVLEEVVKVDDGIGWLPKVSFFRSSGNTDGDGMPKVEEVVIADGDRIKIEYPVIVNDKIEYRYGREFVHIGTAFQEIRSVWMDGQQTGYRFLLPFDANWNTPVRSNWLIKPM